MELFNILELLRKQQSCKRIMVLLSKRYVVTKMKCLLSNIVSDAPVTVPRHLVEKLLNLPKLQMQYDAPIELEDISSFQGLKVQKVLQWIAKQ